VLAGPYRVEISSAGGPATKTERGHNMPHTIIAVPAIDEVRATLEAWRREARRLTYEVDHPVDLEWLNGRIATLSEILDLCNGISPDTDLHARLLGSP